MEDEPKKRKKRSIPDLFSDETPLEFFERKALHIAPRLGVTDARIRAALATLTDHFGKDWLDSEARALRLQDIAAWCDHPLGNMIAFAHESQVADACELAFYLDDLRGLSCLSKAVASLRDAGTYKATLLQLAFASRLRSIGVTRLELEPPVEGGRFGDIAFELDGQSYVVECYVPDFYPILPDGVGVLSGVMKQVADELEGHDGHNVVMLKPKRAVEEKECAAVVAMTCRLLRQDVHTQRAFFNGGFIDIEVRRVSSTVIGSFSPRFDSRGNMVFVGGASAAMKTSLTTEGEIARVRRYGGHLPQTPTKDVILCWSPLVARSPMTVGEWIDRLKNKIDSKFAQTRRNDKPRRLMIVGLNTFFTDEKLGPEVNAGLTELGERLRGRHHENAGTLIADRRTIFYHWSGYQMRLLAGSESHCFPEAVMARLLAQEVMFVGRQRESSSIGMVKSLLQ